MLACLVTLTITFFGLTLYSILQANAALLPDGAIVYLSLKILDTSSAATLFVTLLGALLVRHQFALSLLPRINYKSLAAKKNDIANPNTSIETWRVEMLNSGLGAAVINSTKYVLELSGEKSDGSTGGHKDIINELTTTNLVRDRDY